MTLNRAWLKTNIKEKVDNLIEGSSTAYQNGFFDSAFELLEKAWNELPAPKEIYDDSYHIAKYIIMTLLKAENYSLAEKWAGIIQNCSPERQDIGEKEFIAGQVAFESGEKDTAKRFFDIANNKSDGMCFEGEDTKYKQFYENG